MKLNHSSLMMIKLKFVVLYFVSLFLKLRQEIYLIFNLILVFKLYFMLNNIPTMKKQIANTRIIESLKGSSIRFLNNSAPPTVITGRISRLKNTKRDVLEMKPILLSVLMRKFVIM